MATPIQRNIIREIQRLHACRAPLNIPAVKRSHPKLVARVYAVRPFWGWKRALEDGGLNYTKINTELRDYVDCKVCGRDFGALDVHLLRKHDLTADDYRLQYPDAETTCETLRATIARNRLRKRTVLPRWEEIWTPEYVLDRMAEMHRRNFPLNLFWSSIHDPALAGKPREYFGSWDEALRRIGLDPEQIRLAQPTEHLTKEQLIARLRERRDEGLPQGSALRENDDSPLSNAARKYFGSWSAALRAAGIEPAGEKSHWPKANKAAIAAEIRRRSRAGESLRYSKVGREKWGRALQNRAEALFGTWSATVLAAGVAPPAGATSPWPKAGKAAITTEIRRRKRAGESLETTKIQREKWGGPLLVRCKTLFGSWSAALLAAGIDLPAGIMTPWARANKAAILSEIRRRQRAAESLRYSSVGAGKWGLPLLKRAESLFGSWTDALLAAGVEPPAAVASPWPTANKAAILAEIRRRKGAGKSVRYTHIEQEKWGKPLLRRGATLFGSWNVTLLAADIVPVKANSPWPTAESAAVLAEIRRRSSAGQPVASTKIARERWGRPLLRRATALFGSWTGALLAAGLRGVDLPERRRWSRVDRAAVLAEINRRNRAGESLRSTEVAEGGAPLRRRAKTLFGSWNAALLAAGITVSGRGRKRAAARPRKALSGRPWSARSNRRSKEERT